MKGVKLFQEAQFFAIQGLKFFLTLIPLILNPVLSHAFDSGSTGADGPFAPSVNTTLTLPPDGIFNFTTVNIPSGVTVTFTKNATNTPVVILATGNVTISGTIDVSGEDAAPAGTAGGGNTGDDGQPGEGGPGGFSGGTGGLGGGFGGSLGARGGDGIGPGGGIGGDKQDCCSQFPESGGGGGFATPGLIGFISGQLTHSAPGGPAYGTLRLLPLVGGSGGGAGGGGSGFTGAGGGGGGGALLLAASGTITISGSINADGGRGGLSLGTGCGGDGGHGSGGAIRLIADKITGNGTLFARQGGVAGTTQRCISNGGGGGDGRISLEANTITFSGTNTPNFIPGTPGSVFPPGLPTLAVTDVGGVTAPAAPGGSFSALDITLPIGTTSPVTVSLAATSIPVGTVIQVTRFLERGAKATVNSTPLSGTDASSTATASVSLSSGVPAVVQASATFEVTLMASNPFPVFVQGEKVEKVRVATTFEGSSSIFLITESGREVLYQGVVSE